MRCKACQLANADELTKEIQRGGFSIARLAKKYRVSYPTISRHRDHILAESEDKDDSEIKQELRALKDELKEAKAKGDRAAIKSILLAITQYRGYLQKEVKKGADLESRFMAFANDGELQLYCLDMMTNGRGWNLNRPEFHDRKLAAEAAERIQKNFERSVRQRKIEESREYRA